jgi:hypothetical protein
MSVAASLSGMRGWLGGAIWWLAPAAVVVGGMGLRLAIELRRCIFATVLIVLALGCWGTAAAAHFGLLPITAGQETIMIAAGTLMAGHALLLISLFVYARYVVLEAGGKITPRAAKPKREKKPKAKSSDEASDKDAAEESAVKKSKNLRVDQPHAPKLSASTSSSRAPLQTSTKASSSQWTDGSEEDDYDEDDENRKLSKADRKRLRRQRAREERAGL